MDPDRSIRPNDSILTLITRTVSPRLNSGLVLTPSQNRCLLNKRRGRLIGVACIWGSSSRMAVLCLSNPRGNWFPYKTANQERGGEKATSFPGLFPFELGRRNSKGKSPGNEVGENGRGTKCGTQKRNNKNTQINRKQTPFISKEIQTIRLENRRLRGKTQNLQQQAKLSRDHRAKHFFIAQTVKAYAKKWSRKTTR